MADPKARLWPLPTLLALAVYAALAWHFDFLVDDAFISYRYGAHLAAGHGLVWNVGESPPVEGYSNWLWVVLCAALERMGADPALWTRVVGVACGALLVALLARLVAARIGAGSTRLGAAAFLAALPPIGVWATGGLETMAFALAVFRVFERLAIERARPRTLDAAWAAVLAVLLRADGFAWVAIALAAALLVDRRDKALRRAVALAAGVAAAAALAYLAFRWTYFGQLAPNTARIKVALGPQYLLRGGQYVASLLLCVVSLPLALSGALWAARRDKSGLALPALAAVGASFAYLIVLGGDWMMMYRLLVPALPFAALALGCWLGTMRSGIARTFVGATCAVLAALPAFDVHPLPRSWRERAHFRWGHVIPAEEGTPARREQDELRAALEKLERAPLAAGVPAERERLRRRLEYASEYAVWRKGVVDIEYWIEIGKALGLHTQPGESIVLGNIGAFGYYAPELVVYDTQGLTNREPLKPEVPGERNMPGHDRRIEIGDFAKYQPTYYNARVVDAARAWEQLPLPRDWSELDANGAVLGPNEAARARFDFQLVPLDPAQGFRPGRALILIRNRR